MLIYVPVIKHLPGRHDQKKHGAKLVPYTEDDAEADRQMLERNFVYINDRVNILRAWNNRVASAEGNPNRSVSLKTAISLLETTLPSGTKPHVSLPNVTSLSNVLVIFSSGANFNLDIGNPIFLRVNSIKSPHKGADFTTVASEYVKHLEDIAPLLGYHYITAPALGAGPADYYADHGYKVDLGTLPLGNRNYFGAKPVSNTGLTHNTLTADIPIEDRLTSFCKYSYLKFLYTELIGNLETDYEKTKDPSADQNGFMAYELNKPNPDNRRKSIVSSYLGNQALDIEPSAAAANLIRKFKTTGELYLKDFLNVTDGHGASYLIYGLREPNVMYVKEAK